MIFLANGQPQYIQFPYKFQQMQQPAATSSPNPQPIQPQTMSLRPLGPGYYLQTPNGTFFVQG
jgi:hypothetical protein